MEGEKKPTGLQKDIQLCCPGVWHEDGQLWLHDFGGQVREDLLHEAAGSSQDQAVDSPGPNIGLGQQTTLPCLVTTDYSCIGELTVAGEN